MTDFPGFRGVSRWLKRPLAKGALLVGDGDQIAKALAPGAEGTVLTRRGANSSGLAWEAGGGGPTSSDFFQIGGQTQAGTILTGANAVLEGSAPAGWTPNLDSTEWHYTGPFPCAFLMTLDLYAEPIADDPVSAAIAVIGDTVSMRGWPPSLWLHGAIDGYLEAASSGLILGPSDEVGFVLSCPLTTKGAGISSYQAVVAITKLA